jgi:hypothetical protein
MQPMGVAGLRGRFKGAPRELLPHERQHHAAAERPLKSHTTWRRNHERI